MKNLIALISACFFTIFSYRVNAGEREDAMKLVDNALVLVRHACIFNTAFKYGGETKVVFSESLSGMGSGAFVDMPQKTPNQYNIFTAGHVVDCSVRWYTKRLEEIAPYGADSLELKGSTLRTEIKYNGFWYPASAEIIKFDENYPDYALLLTTVLPEGVRPHLIPFGVRRGEYGVGSRVVFRGFMGIGANSKFNGADHGMMIMLDEAMIQYMGDNFFRISIAACPGMSGSPILLWKDGKYYAIGIVSAGYLEKTCGDSLNTAIITDLDFLNTETKTAPN